MGSNSIIVKCAKCSTILDSAPNIQVEQRTPCQNCGSMARAFEVVIGDTVTVRGSLRMKARHGTGGRPFHKTKSGADLHRATGRWMERDLVVDHENDRYFELVVDPETGEVLHICEEPLSKHRGHGTAKRKSSGKSG